MDVSSILDGLNEAQRDAVTAPLGKLRVLAGAGSGKTRVLVHRIAWLIGVENASPYSILAVTFTNKAAGEMRARIESMLGTNLATSWVGTFHSICHRILRTHHERAGLIRDFQILDRDDQLRLVKRLMRQENIDEKILSARQIVNTISQYKEAGKRLADIDTSAIYHPIEKWIVHIYAQYEHHCRENSLVDFTELLLRTVELIRDHEMIRTHYQTRFQHILVDEFQDTNRIQYAFIQLLVTDSTDLLVVGDDDQSIYAFRGAKIEHILDLEKRFPRLNTIKLEQNYRSTGHILRAANAVIAKNSGRLDKTLWTESGDGEKIDVYPAFNEYDEAAYVIERIKMHIERGGLHQDIAILYRSNAQSRLFEENLLGNDIPYRIYGGLRFFDRAEIKDAIAYLRLCLNHADDVAFERVVNNPPRGIGQRTIEQIREIASRNQFSLWQALAHAVQQQSLPPRATQAVSQFMQLITDTQHGGDSLPTYLQRVIDNSGLRDHIKQQKDERRLDKLENLAELITAAEQFENHLSTEEKADAIGLFLAKAALDAGETQASNYSDYVQLMTLHSAKGLEFPTVFMVGVEEGLFPHQESAMITEQLEEERRLAYVGITRAEQKLHISYAEKRRLYGTTLYPRASRFIEEIPAALLHFVRGTPTHYTVNATNAANATNANLTNSASSQSNQPTIQLGSLIAHPTFGEGTVTALEGDGERQRVQVNFSEQGSKWLVLAFAKIQVLS
ncbi:DNA helicase II [Ostreibacterium oceani]|uniref:DNA 3'-5' helicase n=1 Tax=Ostreibacterium oceani TaxID=2654998 RepID=A0A6N7EUT3_9GAMM|nr:DNA helicase II [Ostreibacterium oceani]MPV86321.1 DNA helicase II [Ostreibacterium oceani]